LRFFADERQQPEPGWIPERTKEHDQRRHRLFHRGLQGPWVCQTKLIHVHSGRVVKIGSAAWRAAAPASYTGCVIFTGRRFVLLVLGGALAGGAAVLSGQLGIYRLDEETRRRLRALTAKQFLVVQALARRVLASDGSDAPSPDQVGVAAWIDQWL